MEIQGNLKYGTFNHDSLDYEMFIIPSTHPNGICTWIP